MEILVFLIGATAVMLFIARERIGGRSRSKAEQIDFDTSRPIGYGANISPPGTSRAATSNAPFFGRDHAAQQHRADGAE
jgi:hypothetical protein